MSAPPVPIAHFCRRYRLSASHRLHAESLSEAENRAAYGKCNNPHGHGHNYLVEVAFAGPVDPLTGMVVDLVALDTFARDEVLATFDLANLNVLAAFAGVVPTTENFAVELHGRFARFRDARFPLARLARIRVEETGNNSFDFEDGDAGSLGG